MIVMMLVVVGMSNVNVTVGNGFFFEFWDRFVNLEFRFLSFCFFGRGRVNAEMRERVI